MSLEAFEGRQRHDHSQMVFKAHKSPKELSLLLVVVAVLIKEPSNELLHLYTEFFVCIKHL